MKNISNEIMASNKETATLKNFTRWDVRNMPGLYDPEYDKLALELFHQKGYVIFKSFISAEEAEHCRKNLVEEARWRTQNISYGPESGDWDKQVHRPKAATHEHIKFTVNVYDSIDKCETFIEKTYNRILDTRVRASLQLGSNGLMAQQMLIKELFPKASGEDGAWTQQDSEKLIGNAKKEFSSWIRWMRYKNGQHMEYHNDAPGEIQSILFLTKKGVGFKDGGLQGSLYDRDDMIDLESMAEPGDLVMLNGYHFVHSVRPITCTEDQTGRITLFVPGSPYYG